MTTKKNIPNIPWQNIILALTFAILALIVLKQANPGTEPPRRDYGIFVYVGEQIVKGKLLYQDVWDNKPPAIFYLNALSLRVGRGSRWGVWLVEYFFLFSAILVSFRLMKRLWGTASSLFGLLTWLYGLDLTLGGGNFTEEYPLVLHFISLTILLILIDSPNNRLYNLLLGFIFSVSFLFRANNAFVEALVICIASCIQLIRKNHRTLFVNLSLTTMGALIPLLAVSGYFFAHGVFEDMLNASILYNLSYGSARLSSSSPLITGFQYLKLSAWVALTGYILMLFYLKRSFKESSFYLYMALLAGWPIMIYMSDPAGRSYEHYFINWLPFIALLSGFALHNLQTTLPQLAKYFHLPVILSPLTILTFSVGYFILGGSAASYGKSIYRIINGPFIEIRSPISIYVENHTRPGEYVLFWATLPGENFMSNREAPYSNIYYPMLVDSAVSKKLNDDFIQDIRRNPPVLVVDMGHLDPLSLDPIKRAEQRAAGIGWPYPPDNLEQVFSYIENNYYLDANIKGKNVYRLYGTTPP